MATAPQYAATPYIATGFLSVANPNRDGTGAVVSVAFGQTNGTRIDRVVVQALLTTAAGMVRLYLTPPGGALAARLFMEIPVGAVTASATTPAFHQEVSLAGGLMLPDDWILEASTQQAAPMWVSALGAAF